MKVNVKARMIISIIFTAACLFGWWLSGFNFDTRGDDAVFCLITSLLSLFAGATCPMMDK